MDIELCERARGVMIGAAHGDALGAATERLKLDEIHQKYGKQGIAAYDQFTWPGEAIHRPGSWTDDTQMAVKVAVAIVETYGWHGNQRGIHNREFLLERIKYGFIEWEKEQHNPEQRRGPGSRCLKSISKKEWGTRKNPLNDGMGCGGIMRAYPIGIAFSDPYEAFEVGIDTAILTHGNPNAYYPSGILAMLISFLMSGLELTAADMEVVGYLGSYMGLHDEKIADSLSAYLVAANNVDTDIDPTEAIETLVGHHRSPRGGGWLGHDALAIGVYCAMCFPDDPIAAVKLSANHSGDTDSTASITGAIMGAIHGSTLIEEHIVSVGDTLEEINWLATLGQMLANTRDV